MFFMNIIIYRYKSICEPDFISAFKGLGLNVVEDNDGMSNELSLDQKIQRLGALIAENIPLFVFTINYYPFISILCEKLHVFYVSMTVDVPVFEIFNTSIRSPYNRIFLFDRDQYNEIHSENPSCIFHLPLGAACERISGTLGDTDNYKYDISFVGSLYNEKDPLAKLSGLQNETKDAIDMAIRFQLESEVYGHLALDSAITPTIIDSLKQSDEDFYPSALSIRDISKYVALKDYICPHMTYVERVKVLRLLGKELSRSSIHLFTNSSSKELSQAVTLHGTVDSLKEMPFVFRQSKINLNITTRSISSGLSQRIWDVLACRGFLITNYQPEIDLFFKDGIHLVTYKSYDELIEKASYYLSHEDERESIALNGYKEACETGSVTARTIEMLRIITGS